MASDEVCPVCLLAYEKFRTGENYRSVYASLWRASEEPTAWRNKRRKGILGAWHGLKRMMWDNHLRQCEEWREWAEKNPEAAQANSVLWDNVDFDEY